MEGRCRLCDEACADASEGGSRERVSALLGIEMSPDDGMSQALCSNCRVVVDEMHAVVAAFRRKQDAIVAAARRRRQRDLVRPCVVLLRRLPRLLSDPRRVYLCENGGIRPMPLDCVTVQCRSITEREIANVVRATLEANAPANRCFNVVTSRLFSDPLAHGSVDVDWYSLKKDDEPPMTFLTLKKSSERKTLNFVNGFTKYGDAKAVRREPKAPKPPKPTKPPRPPPEPPAPPTPPAESPKIVSSFSLLEEALREAPGPPQKPIIKCKPTEQLMQPGGAGYRMLNPHTAPKVLNYTLDTGVRLEPPFVPPADAVPVGQRLPNPPRPPPQPKLVRPAISAAPVFPEQQLVRFPVLGSLLENGTSVHVPDGGERLAPCPQTQPCTFRVPFVHGAAAIVWQEAPQTPFGAFRNAMGAAGVKLVYFTEWDEAHRQPAANPTLSFCIIVKELLSGHTKTSYYNVTLYCNLDGVVLKVTNSENTVEHFPSWQEDYQRQILLAFKSEVIVNQMICKLNELQQERYTTLQKFICTVKNVEIC